MDQNETPQDLVENTTSSDPDQTKNAIKPVHQVLYFISLTTYLHIYL